MTRASCARMALIAGTTAAITAAASAQTTSIWDTATSGNWNDPVRWRNGLVPNNSGPNLFSAVIDVTGAAYDVTLTTPVTIENGSFLSSDATIHIESAGLRTNQDLRITGALVQGAYNDNTLDIRGMLRLDSARIHGVHMVSATGGVTFDGTNAQDICDTCIVYGGASGGWTNTCEIQFNSMGNMTGIDFLQGSVFTITSNAQVTWNNAGIRPTIDNAGTIVKTSGGGLTRLRDVTLNNTGTLDIRSGTLRSNGVSLASGALVGGTWKVSGGASIDLRDAADVNPLNITINRAKITIDGAASTFTALNTLTTNDTSGELTVSGGKVFTTTGNFRNDGKLTVGAGSRFEVSSGSTLGNYNAGTLTGIFDLSGVLAFTNTGITRLEGKVTLNGPNARIEDPALPGVNSLRVVTSVGTTGSISLKGGTTFTTAGSIKFEGLNSGTLDVEAGSSFIVPGGSQLQNYTAGTKTLSEGDFKVQGTLKFDNVGIESLTSKLTLDGTAATVTDTAGTLDTLAGLTNVGANGRISILNRAGMPFSPTPVGGVFTVAAGGTISIDEPSEVVINGDLFNYNSVNGEFTDGTFDISGKLRAANIANVRAISSRVILSSTTGRILPLVGEGDIFSTVEVINPSGDFTVSNGRDLHLTFSPGVTNRGLFTVGPGNGMDFSVVTVDHKFIQEAGRTTLRAGGVLHTLGDFCLTGGELMFDGGGLQVDGDFLMTGGTLGGDGVFNGSVVANGTVSPGMSAGRLLITGDLMITPQSRILIELGGITPITQYDQLDVAHAISFEGGLAGLLDIRRLADPNSPDGFYTPNPGDRFAIINGGSILGQFASIEGLRINDQLHFEARYTQRGVYLEVIGVPAPGAAAIAGVAALFALRRRR